MAALALLPAFAVAQDDPEQLGVRLRAAVAGYQHLVEGLDLSRVPTDAPDYRLVADNLHDLGERLEALSRLALQTEAAAQPDWSRLATAVQLFENDLQQLRRQSLPLRVWAFQKRSGQKKPAWGLAVDRTLQPLPRAQGAFDAEVLETLELTAKPDVQMVLAQIIVVPLTKDLRRVRAEAGDLKGPGGKLPAEGIELRPVDYVRLEQRGPSAEGWISAARGEGRPDVPCGSSQAFILTITAPQDLKPGEYRGRLRFNPDGAKAQELDLIVTVP